MRQPETIIIKRARRQSAAAAKSGGAWKVAFADFTLAMMALFLVLWILAVSSQNERVVMATKLREYSVLDKEANPFDISNSPFPIDLEGQPSVLDEVAPAYIAEAVHVPPNDVFHRDNGGHQTDGNLTGGRLHGKLDSPQQMRQMAGLIDRLAKKLDTRNNLTLQLVPQGLRIQIRDDDERQMFPRGSTQISPFFHQLLRSLASVLATVDNRVMISGHTDSVPYPDGNYTNWELSGDRAQMARRVLSSGGLTEEHVAQVVAMGDTALALPKEPTASANRRIELLLLNSNAEAQLATLFAVGQPASAPGNKTKVGAPINLSDRQQIENTVERLRKDLATPVSSSQKP
jgi:chemotaxis protein MotB